MAQNSRQTEIEFDDQPGIHKKLKSSGPDVLVSQTNMIQLTTSASDDLERLAKNFDSRKRFQRVFKLPKAEAFIFANQRRAKWRQTVRSLRS